LYSFFLRVRWEYLLRKRVFRLLNRRRPESVQKPEITKMLLYARYFKLIFFILMPLVNYLKHYIKYCFYYHRVKFKVIDVHFLFAKWNFVGAGGVLRELIFKFELAVKRAGGRYRYKGVFGEIVRNLRIKLKKKFIKGFKIAITGRFTRRERLTYKWERRGKVPLSSKLKGIDYASALLQLHHGVCLMEIWIY